MNFKGIVSYILITARSVTSIRFCARHNSYQRIAQSLSEFVPLFSLILENWFSFGGKKIGEGGGVTNKNTILSTIYQWEEYNPIYKLFIYCLESVWEGVLNTNYPSFNPRFRNAFTATNKSLSPITFAIPAEIRRVRCGRRDYGVRRADRSRA